MSITFRTDFTWGSATASHQIEGAPDADGKGPSVWDQFAHWPGKTFQKATADMACEHYRRMESDVALNVLSRGLCSYIQSFREQVFTPQEAGEILVRLTQAKTAPVASRSLHVAGLRERHGGNNLSEMRVSPRAQDRPKRAERGRIVFRLLRFPEVPVHTLGLNSHHC